MPQTLRQIGTIARALDSIANIEFKRLGLSKGQYLYLVRIYENPGIIAEKLVEMLKVDRATVARSLQKLEAKGLISRTKDANNQKILHLNITPKGEESALFVLSEMEYSENHLTRALTAAEKEQLARLLDSMVDHASQEFVFVKKGGIRPYGNQH